ncbi:uncharacterized protein STEHIDRAFT_108076 [Stereum hirsutum FP-91666 SS1]|uniref:uncharacterized protein n=1 Tax=Stereum hirsutum (strain FP-91666) TaxID=721885 RepID=UPI000440B960|nr:uncharacterized protein STEHIDRAFT_108076 [Stereum hirsutum FP-91666 SS1]EIM91547.1 hypothetical protein STEHIDRAFT_108076 [Stereum hirsutum FP-91666 SS1]
MSESSAQLQYGLNAVYCGNWFTALHSGTTRTIRTIPGESKSWLRPYGKSLILDLFHAACVAHMVYEIIFAAALSGSTTIFTAQLPWSVMMMHGLTSGPQGMTLVTALADILIRFFYCYRIWTSMHLLHDSASPILMSVRNEQMVNLARVHDLAQVALLSTDFYVDMALIVFNDTALSVVLIVLLWRKRRFTVKRTASLLNTLIVYTVTTGFLTSLLALAMLITFATDQGLAYLGMFIVLSKLFLNSCLATLNQRRTNKRDEDDTISISMKHMDFAPGVTPTMATGIQVLVKNYEGESTNHPSTSYSFDRV